jgi:hypothetical protein
VAYVRVEDRRMDEEVATRIFEVLQELVGVGRLTVTCASNASNAEFEYAVDLRCVISW